MVEETHVTDEFTEVQYTQENEFMVSLDERYHKEFRRTKSQILRLHSILIVNIKYVYNLEVPFRDHLFISLEVSQKHSSEHTT